MQKAKSYVRNAVLRGSNVGVAEFMVVFVLLQSLFQLIRLTSSHIRLATTLNCNCK